MSNLATMIMEGSNYGSNIRLSHSYDHEFGAGMIAMESAEALRDIFEAEFYVPNTCTIAATLEGASCVEESTQAAIMEASVKGVFAKIKEFFIKLKNKILEFLHNVKRYLTGLFGNDEKWVKAYENDLTALTSTQLKGYEVKMYKYTIQKPEVLSVATIYEDLMKDVDKAISSAYKNLDNTKETDEEALDDQMDKKREAFLKGLLDVTEDEEVDKAAWSKYRDGADNETDMETVSVGPSQIKEYIKELKESSKVASNFDTISSRTSQAYDKVIKFINTAEGKVSKSDKDGVEDFSASDLGLRKGFYDNEEDNKTYAGSTAKLGKTSRSNYAMALRKLSSYCNKCQGYVNKMITAHKGAYSERNAAYKKALTGAFAYARKNKSK